MKNPFSIDLSTLLSRRYRKKQLLNNKIVQELIKDAYFRGKMDIRGVLLHKDEERSPQDYLNAIRGL
jgi:hypothetical protein